MFHRAWGELDTWYRHCSSSRGEACSYRDPNPSFVRCYPPGSGIRHCEGVPLRSRRPQRRACLFASCSRTVPRHAYLSCTLLSLLCSLCFGPPGAGETLTYRHPAIEIIYQLMSHLSVQYKIGLQIYKNYNRTDLISTNRVIMMFYICN